MPFTLEFTSEFKDLTRAHFRANVPRIKREFSDLRDRQRKDYQHVDVYVAGFPCQPFSAIGKRLGLKDPKRGAIVQHILEFIKATQPKVVLLENVKNFKFIEGGEPFRILIDALTNINDASGQPVYKVNHYILGAAQFGIPQSRNRLYVVCIPFASDDPYLQ